jgi:hypothetical protein
MDFLSIQTNIDGRLICPTPIEQAEIPVNKGFS